MKTIDEATKSLGLEALLKEIEAGLQQFGICPKCGLNVEVRHRYGCEVAERDSVADAKALIAMLRYARLAVSVYTNNYAVESGKNYDELMAKFDAELLALAEGDQ